MGEFGGTYERELGQIQERLQHLQRSVDALRADIDRLCTEYDRRCGALERWRSYCTGIGVILALAWGGLLAWLKKL